jgi:transcriptional regulator GlxA family with amidase domain
LSEKLPQEGEYLELSHVSPGSGEPIVLTTIFAPLNVHLLEVAGVCDALFEANIKLESGSPYRVRVVTEDGLPAGSASGVKFVPDASIGQAIECCDTLIVVGPHGEPVPPTEAATRWLRKQCGQSRRYGSTCTGAFLLAHAGLLSGRRVTTHWQYAARLAAQYPDIRVEPDRIFVRDGPVFSSAGVTAAIDLAFSLIEEDHGRALALWVARRLVVFLKRPGGQSQFSAALTAQTSTTSPIDRIRLHILEHPQADLGLEGLAGVAGVSPRHLSRLFQTELAMSPAAYVELTRVDIARRLLEDSEASIKAITYASGFGSPTTLRRAFLRRIGITPVEYRVRFQTTHSQASANGGGAVLS